LGEGVAGSVGPAGHAFPFGQTILAIGKVLQSKTGLGSKCFLRDRKSGSSGLAKGHDGKGLMMAGKAIARFYIGSDTFFY